MTEDYEGQFENYNKLPKVVLDIMNWLCETKFYKKTFDERKEPYDTEPEEDEKWKFCDFTVEEGTLEKPIIIRIGEIPHYEYDREKALVINFEDEEDCYLTRGYAVGLYASKVLRNKYPIPKYMKEKLLNFIKEYRGES